MKEILCTGGTGMIGSQVRSNLRNLKWIDSRESNVNLLIEDQLIPWLNSNSSDAIVHWAAFTDVKESQKQNNDKNGSCYNLNVEVTETIAKNCKENNRHLILFSTGFVFSGNQHEPYTEKQLRDARGWYGLTKIMAEKAVQESGCKYTILRFNYPYGRKGNYKLDWVNKLIEKLNHGENLTLFNDQWINPVWIDDIIRATQSIFTNEPHNQIFHLGPDEYETPLSLVSKLIDIYKFNFSLIKSNSLIKLINENPEMKNLHPQNCRLDNSKFKTAYRFHFTEVSDGLKILRNSLSKT